MCIYVFLCVPAKQKSPTLQAHTCVYEFLYNILLDGVVQYRECTAESRRTCMQITRWASLVSLCLLPVRVDCVSEQQALPRQPMYSHSARFAFLVVLVIGSILSPGNYFVTLTFILFFISSENDTRVYRPYNIIVKYFFVNLI